MQPFIDSGISTVLVFGAMILPRVLVSIVILFFTLLVVHGTAAIPDLVIFDEDDPLGVDYYDASIGEVKAPSELRLRARSGDKMPIMTNSAAAGEVSGVLEWRSRPGGHWAMHIFRPGFGLLDLSGYESLVMLLNAPEPISADGLPVFELRDVRGRTIARGLEEFLAEGVLVVEGAGDSAVAESADTDRRYAGVDGDAGTWQRVRIPLAVFRFMVRSAADFDLSQVRHVTLRQGRPDAESRTLWVDDIRLVAAERAISAAPPVAPKNVAGRAGDRSVTVRWDGVPGVNFRGYHVFRSDNAHGPFTELRDSPVRIRSIADMGVENGRTYYYRVKAANDLGQGRASATLAMTPRAFGSDDEFLEYVQATAFDYFWQEADERTGLVRDRSQPWSAMSIAATGFGLTAIGIGIDHGWITREQGRERTIRILQSLVTGQGRNGTGANGHRGWFYHFLEGDGGRFGTSELSSIDTALLLGGVLYVREYFSTAHRDEGIIRRMADQIFDRIDWRWMLNGGDTLSMGWKPESGFLSARWQGYNEASILYILGLGAKERNRLEPEHWENWTRTYQWKSSHGYDFVHFPPLFGHQYSACWIDFRNIADDYMRAEGISYFENSRRATLAQREYCIANPGGFKGYGPNVWGLTACDGPGSNDTHSYIARGAPPSENDDGTIAPTAAGGSIPFAPEECIRALRHMYETYREKIWCGYGFRDAFNIGENWWGADVIGIDQGPILVMVENYRTGRVWEVLRGNEVIQRGLKRAGFRPATETPPQD